MPHEQAPHIGRIERFTPYLYFFLAASLASPGYCDDVRRTARRTSSQLARIAPSDVLAASRQIDHLVSQQLDGQLPGPLASDETFVRRIYLDVVGRIPTLTEVTEFLTSHDADKRFHLIDTLLESPGYTSHYFNFWADILRAKSRLDGARPGQPYVTFIKDSLTANTPYDEWVRQMLTSSGHALAPGNGATGYFLRDLGMPEDNAANTLRVFLGTRIECAQCHDHPFDEWTQRDFYETVAFFGGVQMRLPLMADGQVPMRRKVRQIDAPTQVKQAANRLLRRISFGVAGGGTGLAKLPDSYQSDDGAPNEIVTAKTLFTNRELVKPHINPRRRGSESPMANRREAQSTRVPGATDVDSRRHFADWLTSPDNPRFTIVIANRLWRKAMGIGLIEPHDDLNADTLPSNHALMDFLCERMIAVDYDMKQYLRTIFYSQTYQRSAHQGDLDEPSRYDFSGPLVRRMTAEQLWDSALTLTIDRLDTRENVRSEIAKKVMLRDDPYRIYRNLSDMSADEFIDLVRRNGDPKARRARQREMMREVMESARDEANMTMATDRKRLTKLRADLKRARQQKDIAAAQRLQAEIRQLTSDLRHRTLGAKPDMVRASELPSPAPAGHFLRAFGQSDRDQIENANAEPAVTQVLLLMNGPIEQGLINNPRTVLMQHVSRATTRADKIDTVFLAVLSRYPTDAERELWLNECEQVGDQALPDLIWTLANANEFLFIR